MDDFLQDVRYAFRQLRNAPLFALTATMSLALGIGANAAVFTVIERVLLRPLPVATANQRLTPIVQKSRVRCILTTREGYGASFHRLPQAASSHYA